jgi:hypothetical protein
VAGQNRVNIVYRKRRKIHGSAREPVKYDRTERRLGQTFYTTVFK